AEVESRRAMRRQNERRVVNEAVSEYLKLPDNRRNLEAEERIGADLARKLYPNERDEKQQMLNEKRIQDKVGLAVVHGETDALAEPVVSAQSNEAKIEIIYAARSQYTPADLNRWLHESARRGIISTDVLESVNQKLRDAHQKKQQRELTVQ